ncbi:hypothetical protein LPJ61_002830, partial [Coemansia biformis]
MVVAGLVDIDPPASSRPEEPQPEAPGTTQGSCSRLWNRNLAAVLNFKHIVDGLNEM